MSEIASDTLPSKILESIPFGFIQVDLTGKIIYANNSAFTLLEMESDKLIGSIFDKLPWDQMTDNHKPLKQEDHTIYQALNGITTAGAVRVLKFKDRLKWFSVNTAPFHDDEGAHIGAISNFIDITVKVQNELKIKESEERYEKLIDEAPYAITIYNKEGILITANNKCEEYWKFTPSENIGKFNIFENELFQYPKAEERIKHAFEGNAGEFTTSITLPHAGNEEHKYKIKYYPLFDLNDELDKVVYFTEDITLLDQVVQKTENEEKLKQEILDALGDGILVVDNEGRILSINKGLRKYKENQNIKELNIGVSIFELIDRLDEYDFLKESLSAILKGESSYFDHQLKLKDNKWYSIKVTPLIGRIGAVITFQNINTRKEIEMALEKSLKKYRNIYNKAPVMMHSVDRNGKIVSVSDFWLEKMGYDRNVIIGKSPKFFIAKSSHKTFEKSIQKLFKEGVVRNINYQFVKKSGETIEVILGAVAEYDENGNFERSIAGMIDITDQKKIEKDLNESKTKLIEAQRLSKIGNYEIDVKTGKFISSSEVDFIMGLHYSEEDLSINQKVLHPEDFEEFNKKMEECIRKKEDFFHIYRIYHLKTKKLKWISGRGKMVLNDAGEVVKVIGTVQDITEQRAAEDKIKKLSDRILLSTEIAKLGVWEYDAGMDQVFWEDQMYVIFPDFSAPFKLDEFREIIADENDDFISEKINLIENGVNFLETEVRVMVEDKLKYLRTFTRIIRRDNGELKGMVGVVYDVTEDKKLQNELEVSLEEKNILIREVHHRVKNNMQLISSIMALKAYDLKDEESKAIFDEINTRIKAMSVIYDRLYKFYNVSEIDIKDFLSHISKDLGTLLGISTIDLKVDIIREVFSIDHALILGLMVVEMVTNAVKHSFEKLSEGEINIVLTRESSDKLTLSVTNNGSKIAPDVLTGAPGIGISMIKTFARQLKGDLSLHEDNGFKVEF